MATRSPCTASIEQLLPTTTREKSLMLGKIEGGRRRG